MEKNVNVKRIDTLDYLRGFALMGVVLVNILPLLAVPETKLGTADGFMRQVLYFTVESRFFLIFSFLFGLGFYLFISRAQEKGVNSTLLYIRRLSALLLLGIVHQLYHPGEALFFYAIFGFILLPFYKLKASINLWLALLSIVPAAIVGGKVLMILPMFWLGLALGQYRLFEQIPRYLSIIKGVQWLTLIMTIIGLYIQYRLIPSYYFLSSELNLGGESMDTVLWQEIQNYTLAITLVGLVMSAFYVSSLIRMLENKVVQKLLSPLKYYGQMALTNYLGQTVLILWVNYQFDLYGKLGEVQTSLICLGIYILQMTFSLLWLSYFRMGPLEWIWRMFTYWSIPALRH